MPPGQTRGEATTNGKGARRDVILTEAARLFSKRGVGGATVREIAEAAGILSGSLYHYFPSKDAIVSEILVRYLDDLLGQYQRLIAPGATARTMLHQLVHVSLRVAADHPYATEIYQNEFDSLRGLPEYDRISSAVRESHRFWQQVVDKGVADGEFRLDIRSSDFQQMIRELVWMEVRWQRDRLATEHARLANVLITVFLDGFATGREGTPAPVTVPAPDRVEELAVEIAKLKESIAALQEGSVQGGSH